MPGYENRGRFTPINITQNYLTSSVVIDRILKRTTLNKNDQVIEIGPGKGHITRALLPRCGTVTAVEFDESLFRFLKSRFAGVKNLHLINQDFLSYKLPPQSPYKVFSNIPFSRTSEIIRKLTGCRNAPEEIWLAIEKGAAKRFMGHPRESKSSLFIKPFFTMEILYYFKREDFHPKPGVDVVLLHLKKKPVPDIAPPQRQAYKRFIETGLQDNGRRLKKILTPKQISKALREAGFSNEFTPAHLLYVQWLCLFRCWATKAGPRLGTNRQTVLL